ncbi:hypothetical protein RGP44_002894 [Serratia marcescens]|uniref:hypothetical protein n=1 Tax=Serratia TaxID=613 RepID=UPI000448ED3C|nr:hypothetical protein [Serratia marcescens]ELN4405953.1 hypothetical protein [Serratia marcescens]ETX38544.1 hypothetical protein P805_04404 [Serratia marcescens BIDMC 44]MBH2737433.1 hypothetical protein [Serratia marcescens]OFB47481.1 hypothetical protein BA187_19345 [Serratia marcescens]CVE90115.1 Uncharacterised protein [Serratia marcescens]
MNLKHGILLLTMIASCSAFASSWKVSYQNDEMRGTSQKLAYATSDNLVNFEFPYNGGSRLGIMIASANTKLGEGEKPDSLPLIRAMLFIDKGQFQCNPYNDCHISVKFDNGEIQSFPMEEASAGRADAILVSDSDEFINNLKKHKTLIIEAEFYRAGNKQFKFNLDDFPDR